MGSNLLSRRRQWHPTPVLLPGKSHGWRSLVGCSPWGREELDTTERLHFHFSLSRIGEGTGNPLQCSCLENPRDRGAWWAAVCGVAQSWTRLKRLSSSSNLLSVKMHLHYSFIYSLIHSPIQQIYARHPLHARHVLAAGDRVVDKAGFMPSQSSSLGRQTIDQEADMQYKCR